MRHIAEKPELVVRKHFKDGEFSVDGLKDAKYQMQILSPMFVPVKMILDFNNRSHNTDYSIIILHPFRNEARLTPGAAYTVSAKVLQQKIPDAAKEAYLKGVGFHREGKLDAALIEYGSALRADPKYLEALTDIGTILLLYNRPDAALTFLERAREVDDNNPIVKLNIAVGMIEQSDYGNALRLLKDVLDREPRLAVAQYFVAKVKYQQKKIEEAATYAQRALESDPELLDAWALSINLSLEQNKLDQARAGLEHIRETVRSRMAAKFIDEQLSDLGS